LSEKNFPSPRSGEGKTDLRQANLVRVRQAPFLPWAKPVSFFIQVPLSFPFYSVQNKLLKKSERQKEKHGNLENKFQIAKFALYK
jgi:hypothetical protein